MSNQYMKDKQKVTLYIPPELHRQLKIQSAVDSEPMSAIAERALMLYLEHPEALHPIGHGHTHQIHNCPKCQVDFVIQEGEAIAVSSHPSSADSSHIIDDIDDAVERSTSDRAADAYSSHQERDPEELVPC